LILNGPNFEQLLSGSLYTLTGFLHTVCVLITREMKIAVKEIPADKNGN
jgi:hypothetical protein